MKKKLIIVPGLLFALIGVIGLSCNMPNRSIKLSLADASEEALNLVKAKVSRTFDMDYLPVGTETTAVMQHKNYDNANKRKANIAKSPNIFLSDKTYSIDNTELVENDPFIGTGYFKRVKNNGASGLALRSNTDNGYLPLTHTGDFALSFYVKNYVLTGASDTNYYGGLLSFRGWKGGAAENLWNIDIGMAGFWVNKINNTDFSDNTNRKYITSTTSSWAGRTTYNGFDNGSFAIGTSGDAMKEDQWYQITYNFSTTDGITIYRDGVKKVNFAPSCVPVVNKSDTDNFTVGTIVDKLHSILTSKNAVMMVFRGQSSFRPVGTCLDQADLFTDNLTEEEMLLWRDSFKTVSYYDDNNLVHTYRDMVCNLIPEYTLEDKEDKTFYKWATDKKLLTQIGSSMPNKDFSAYADFKDEDGISDGAKILADDIIDLDTCTDYPDVDIWQDKVDLLDLDDMEYVLDKEFVGTDLETYTVGYKLAYMHSLKDAVATNNSFDRVLNSNNSSLVILITVLSVSLLLATTLLVKKKKHQK